MWRPAGGSYAVKVGYIDVQEGCILFRGVICCLGGLNAVQEGYMDVQEGYVDAQEGYMLKKIMIFFVANNVVASRVPECEPPGTPTVRANLNGC